MAEHIGRLDFVILDELGYLPFVQSGGQLLSHHCDIVETGNESWRFKNRS